MYKLFFLMPSYYSFLASNPVYKRSCGFQGKVRVFSKREDFKITPKTSEQKRYWEALREENTRLVLSEGPAGTGKTFFACKFALQKFNEEYFKKIIVTRPIVSVADEQFGYLPGTKEDKMEPWLLPLYDCFKEAGLTSTDLKDCLKYQKIEVVPLGFMRGRTFHNSVIIADEMQNSTPDQMKMILTRIGRGSKMIVTGDLNQCDLKSSDNGLYDICKRLDNSDTEGIELIKFKNEDVQRDPFVKTVLDVYSRF